MVLSKLRRVFRADRERLPLGGAKGQNGKQNYNMGKPNYT